MKTRPDQSPLIQMYEKAQVKEYYISRAGFLNLSRYDEVVYVEKLGSELVLKVNTTKDPDKVLINGKMFIEKI